MRDERRTPSARLSPFSIYYRHKMLKDRNFLVERSKEAFYKGADVSVLLYSNTDNNFDFVFLFCIHHDRTSTS
jgi:hypothetical protein